MAAQEARVVAAGRDWKGVLSVRVTEDCPVASLSALPPYACPLLTDRHCSCLTDGEKSAPRDVILMDTLGPGKCRCARKRAGKIKW